MATVFFYISGHGFGHASRQIETINALGALRPDLTIVVRTSAPSWLIERTARVPLMLLPGECDTGVVQIDSLRLDEAATIHRARDFYRMLPQRARQEASLLTAHDARLVVSDAPPLACAAAAAAGIPSIVVSNFTWDWIYEGYAEHLSDAAELLPSIRNAYRRAEAAWRLPMHGGFAAFDTIIDVPFIARHARHARDHVRRTLALPLDRPLVLSSFGGYGVSGLDLGRLDCLGKYSVVLTAGDPVNALDTTPAGVFEIPDDTLYGSGLHYEDLVAACDVVATKPGYGIIAECIANGPAILYTSRGQFAEYDVLVREMPRYLRCAYLDHDAIFGGRWCAALDRLLAAPPPPERPATNGATIVAEQISNALPAV